MKLFKELKLIKWPSFKTIVKEYIAILLCSGIFLAIITVANLLTTYLFQLFS